VLTLYSPPTLSYRFQISAKMLQLFCNNLQHLFQNLQLIIFTTINVSDMGCLHTIAPQLCPIDSKSVPKFCNYFATICNTDFRICNLLFSPQITISVRGANFTQHFDFVLSIPNWCQYFATNLQKFATPLKKFATKYTSR
jgi:hypothetical protein